MTSSYGRGERPQRSIEVLPLPSAQPARAFPVHMYPDATLVLTQSRPPRRSSGCGVWPRRPGRNRAATSRSRYPPLGPERLLFHAPRRPYHRSVGSAKQVRRAGFPCFRTRLSPKSPNPGGSGGPGHLSAFGIWCSEKVLREAIPGIGACRSVPRSLGSIRGSGRIRPGKGCRLEIQPRQRIGIPSGPRRDPRRNSSDLRVGLDRKDPRHAHLP